MSKYTSYQKGTESRTKNEGMICARVAPDLVEKLMRDLDLKSRSALVRLALLRLAVSVEEDR